MLDGTSSLCGLLAVLLAILSENGLADIVVFGYVKTSGNAFHMTWAELLSATRIRDLKANRPTPPSRGDRTEFERDHDRTIFSTPFRRLQDKAQVFPLEPIDAVRRRLTHTMEVSTVARGLAGSVVKRLESKIPLDLARHIPVVAETCGLLHDIGNPPFGHSGEDAIREWFELRFQQSDPLFSEISDSGSPYGKDLLNFEGNAQALRLVSKLQLLFDDDGLNLTAGTFSASMKYTGNSLQIGSVGEDGNKIHEHSKLGYFFAESDLVEKVRRATGTGESRNPISFLVEASDDLVYAIVDVEDGIKKGVVSWEFVEAELKDNAGGLAVQECLNVLEAKLATSDFQNQSSERGEAAAQYLRTLCIDFGVRMVCDKFIEAYEDIMAGRYHGELLYESKAGPLYKALKDIGRKRVYCSGETLALELLGKNIIQKLLDLFWTSEKITGKPQNAREIFADKTYSLLSRNYRHIYEKACGEQEHPAIYLKSLLITDYICGMTDSYALRLYQEVYHG